MGKEMGWGREKKKREGGGRERNRYRRKNDLKKILLIWGFKID